MLATSLALGSGAALAGQTGQSDQAKLDRLPYNLRQQVESRMGPDQSVDGVVETMLLNEIADDGFTAVRDVDVIYRARARDADGKWHRIDIDPTTYDVAETSMTSDKGAHYDPKAAQPSQSGTGRPMPGSTDSTRSSDAYSPKAAQPSQTGTGRPMPDTAGNARSDETYDPKAAQPSQSGTGR